MHAAGLDAAGLPREAVQIIETTDREAVGELITMPDFVDVIVPRGGKGLIERISNDARVPVIKHLDGICHVYIDDKADMEKAFNIALNAKTHRYGCNAMETLLVNTAIAAEILPRLAAAYADKGVELRGCEQTQAFIEAKAATEEDWNTEYLAPVYPFAWWMIWPRRWSTLSNTVLVIRSPSLMKITPSSTVPSSGGFQLGHDQCLHPFCRWL